MKTRKEEVEPSQLKHGWMAAIVVHVVSGYINIEISDFIR